MKTTWTRIGLGVCALAALGGAASAQKPSNAERGLIGVNLYDTGAKVVALYGSPDEIQAVSLGGNNTNQGGSGFGPSGGDFGGGPSGGGRGVPGGGGRLAPTAAGADWQTLNGFGNEALRQSGSASLSPSTSSSAGGGRGPSEGGRPGAAGPGMAPGYPGSGSAPGGAPGSSVTVTPTQYTRWVYNRAGSKYGFIVDNQGRVVQIEAIGLQNNRVKTRKGVGFGATFAQLIKTYGNPDGYEVAGDTVLVKYLVNKKVAFRLTRLQAKKPHVVTGVVVSAGKI